MIRIMQDKDVREVALLEQECFSMPWTEASIKKEVGNKDSLFCVCEIEGKVVGYAGMYYAYPEGDITNVAVTKAYRGRGIAKKILDYMFLQAFEDGVKEYTLEVRVGNEKAIHLYEKLGLLSAGIRNNFYDNPKEDAWIICKKRI